MEDIDLLQDVCVNLGGERMMDSRSFCPLGDAAAWPIIWGGLKYFQRRIRILVSGTSGRRSSREAATGPRRDGPPGSW